MQPTNDNIKSGDVFYAKNKITKPPKMKYHLCIDTNLYFLINTKQHQYNYTISPEDCSILHYDCYIDCSRFFQEPIKGFEILMVAQLSQKAIKGIIEKVSITPTLTESQRNIIITGLKKALK